MSIDLLLRLARATLAAIAGLVFPALAQAPGDVRVALVIGNSAYANAPLLNPANDARAMGDTLRGLGFTVIELRDGQKEQMTEAIAKVGTALKGKQGVGLLYYAGHGIQLDWRNYMVPVDAKLGSAADVRAQAVDINTVIDAFKAAGTRMNILVLDACRDNPFAGTASAKGLAQLDAPPGTFLAFATAPGNVAEDGDAKDGNGLYTRFLLEELKKPEATIENVFKRVRLHVRKQSQGRQVPWESTSLEDEFFFNTGKVIPTTMPALRFNTSNLTAMAQPASEIREASFTIEKADWDKIRDSKNPDDFYAYLQKYPSGSISELAQSRLERVAAARIQMVPDQSGDVQKMAAVRYRAGDRIDFVIKDGLTGVVTRRGQAEIKRVSEDEFDTLGLGSVPLRVNSAGFVLRDPSGQYDPPWPTAPGGVFQIGKKWSSRSIVTQPNGNKTWVDIDARIAAREKVTVPMGSFDTYRVDYLFIWQNGSHTKTTFWYHPDIGYALKMVRESRDNRGALDIQVREMAAYQPAGR